MNDGTDDNDEATLFHYCWCPVDKSVTHISVTTLGANSIAERVIFTVVLSSFIIAVDKLTSFDINTLTIDDSGLLQTISYWKQTLFCVGTVSKGDIKLLITSIIDRSITRYTAG